MSGMLMMLLLVVSCLIIMSGLFDLFLHYGPRYSYYPNLSKCCIVVDSSYHECTVQIFNLLGAQVVSSHRF